MTDYTPEQSDRSLALTIADEIWTEAPLEKRIEYAKVIVSGILEKARDVNRVALYERLSKYGRSTLTAMRQMSSPTADDIVRDYWARHEFVVGQP